MCKRFKGKIIDNNIPHLNNNRKEQSNRTSYSEVRLLECHDPTFAFLSRPSSTLWPSILMYSLFFVSNFDSAFQFSFRLSIRLFEQIVMKGFGVLVITCLILSALRLGACGRDFCIFVVFISWVLLFMVFLYFSFWPHWGWRLVVRIFVIQLCFDCREIWHLMVQPVQACNSVCVTFIRLSLYQFIFSVVFSFLTKNHISCAIFIRVVESESLKSEKV